MTNEQKTIVRETFAAVEPNAGAAATLFYEKLFELDPSLRKLFANDPRDQAKKFMLTIKFVVASLDRHDALLPAVEQLSHRHDGYGVADRDFETVGTALLWSLEKELGPKFTSEARSAWNALFSMLTTTMKRVVSARRKTQEEESPIAVPWGRSRSATPSRGKPSRDY